MIALRNHIQKMHDPQICGSCSYTGSVSVVTAAPAGGAATERVDGSGPDACGGLRERKKRATRAAIHRAALELAHSQGIDGATVEAIAERAEVSARTFFNYFHSRDDALIGVNPDAPAEIEAAVKQCPSEGTVREVVHAVMLARLNGLTADRRTWAMRRDLAVADPRIGERMLGAGVRVDRAVVAALLAREARARGEELGEQTRLEVAVAGYSALGAVRAALNQHLDSGMRTPIGALVDRAFAALDAAR